MIILKSLKTKNLSKNLILSICKLKNTHWKNKIVSQKNFFKKNCKSQDLHNLLYHNKKLIGYTLLRKRIFFLGSVSKKYLLFDTIIVDKMFRKQKYAHFLMNFNNLTIKKNKIRSYLLCNKELINFYKNFSWKVENSNKFIIDKKNPLKTVMSFNLKNKNINMINLRI